MEWAVENVLIIVSEKEGADFYAWKMEKFDLILLKEIQGLYR